MVWNFSYYLDFLHFTDSCILELFGTLYTETDYQQLRSTTKSDEGCLADKVKTQIF